MPDCSLSSHASIITLFRKLGYDTVVTVCLEKVKGQISLTIQVEQLSRYSNS